MLHRLDSHVSHMRLGSTGLSSVKVTASCAVLPRTATASLTSWSTSLTRRAPQSVAPTVSSRCSSPIGASGSRWRTRAAGVAKVIKARTPFCTGDHYPLKPHHFSHLQAVTPPSQPRQHFPVHVGTCLPGNAPLPAAARGQATPLPSPINPNVGLAAGRASDQPSGRHAFLLGAYRRYTHTHPSHVPTAAGCALPWRRTERSRTSGWGRVGYAGDTRRALSEEKREGRTHQRAGIEGKGGGGN